MAFWYARQRALQTVAFGVAAETESALAASASVGASGTTTDGVTLTSVTLANESGSNSPADQPYTFGAVFEPGRVFSDGHVEVQFAGSPITFQMDREVRRHTDGSLNRAVFSVLAPTVNAGGSAQLNLVSRASAKPSGSVDTTQLTNDDYSFEIDEGGTTYAASLNDAITAGDYRITRDGPVCRRYAAWRALNDGAVDHADLWVRFYATVFADGTTEVLAQAINGEVDAAPNHTLTEARLLTGATTVWSYSNAGAGWIMNNHSSFYTADTDGKPYWSSGIPALRTTLDISYVRKARAWFEYNPVTPAPPDTATDYLPATTGKYRTSITSGGDANNIGFLPDWTSRAIAMGQEPGWEREDRIHALIWMDVPFVWLERATNTVPILAATEFAGMGPLRTETSWFAGENDFGANYERWTTGTGFSGDHDPEPAYWRSIVEGDEWFDDICLLMMNMNIGTNRSGDGSALTTRRRYAPKTSGGNWYALVSRRQHRAWAWNLRHIECAHWITPEDAVERGYVTDVRTNNYGWFADVRDNAYVPGGSHESHGPLGVLQNGDPENRHTRWEMGYVTGIVSWAWRHDDKPLAVIEHAVDKNFLGSSIEGCTGRWRNDYEMDPDGDGVVHTQWSDVVVATDAEGDPIYYTDLCPASGLINPDGTPLDANTSFNFAQMGLAGLQMLRQAAAERSESALLNRATSVFNYVDPAIDEWDSAKAGWSRQVKYDFIFSPPA